MKVIQLGLHFHPDGNSFAIFFHDSGREPKCPPNPDYPDGIDVDMSRGAEKICTVDLPYSAPRCGVIVLECARCGLRNGLTVAGRRDDPRSVRVACMRRTDEELS
ncbi:MAG: hypothetical protein J2P47_05715 [Acetobacteraceae bacterium]|nr:hypothetical protein [Acetobacteraceae bacterium]